MDEKFLSLTLTDKWEESRPREVNLDTLTIWLGHKNPYPPLLALTPDDPNFSGDLLHPLTARYDYNINLKITEYPNEQTAQQALESYIIAHRQTLNNITATVNNISPQLLSKCEKVLINIGCSKTKGEFFGENAIFFINQKKEKICSAVWIGDFVLTGNIFDYPLLPRRDTPIHSALCALTRSSHNTAHCQCSYCKDHLPCSTIEKEGLVYPEKVYSLLGYILTELKKQHPPKNPHQIALYLIGHSYDQYDCSKSTQTIYQFLPRTAQEQYNYFEKRGAIIFSRNDLRRGDLIFFKDGSGAIKHVGYVVSNIDGNIDFIDSTLKKGVGHSHMNTTGQEGSKNMYGDWHFAGGGRP